MGIKYLPLLIGHAAIPVLMGYRALTCYFETVVRWSDANKRCLRLPGRLRRVEFEIESNNQNS